MKASIIAIGTEILIGQTLDTNSSWLAGELTKIGCVVNNIQVIRDDKTDIVNNIDSCLKTADLIIITGGLGPTNDDITKSAIADYFDSKLYLSDEVLADVEAFLKQRRVKMNNLNRQQAMVPEKALILRNKQGTAPGLLFKNRGKAIICLPGVPHEMKSIMQQYGFDHIINAFDLPNNYYHTILITGISESHLAEKLTDWESELPEQLELAYLPSPGIIRLRLGISGDTEDKMKKLILTEVNKLNKLIPELIVAHKDVKIEQLVGELLEKNKLKLASAESCSGGSIAQAITAIPGCSNWYNGSVVSYSNHAKINILSIPASIINSNGAVSEDVVRLMAENTNRQFKTDYCIATSGIAGPTGGTSEKPVGTVWISVAGPQRTIARKFQFGKERDINIKRTKIAAFNLLLQQIQEDK